MHGFYDLVAGEGAPGLQDGDFYRALFRSPAGLAVDPGGRALYVADQGNHCVRKIDLSANNQVTTLAGNGKPGDTDGPFASARFNKPSQMLLIGPDELLVDDSGNHCFRLLDLAQKKVVTLARYGGATPRRPSPNPDMDVVWNMAYLPSRHAVYFTQPEKGVLGELDLDSRKLSVVLRSDPRLPHPAALCARQDVLYAADQVLPRVYRLKFKDSTAGIGAAPFEWKSVAVTRHALSLAWSGGVLYALQAFAPSPLVELLPKARPVKLVSPWGEGIPGASGVPYFSDSGAFLSMPLVPDPVCEGRFYLPHPALNIVTAFRDLGQDKYVHTTQKNPDGITENEYPHTKPPGTFRILMVGDSHSYFITGDNDNEKPNGHYNRMRILPKRLEWILNAEASLGGSPIHYEVLMDGDVSSEPLNLRAYYETPTLVEKYDIDLVLLMVSPSFMESGWKCYFERPLDAQGVPARKPDTEYALKPWKEKVPRGTPQKLLDLCRDKQLLAFNERGQVKFGDSLKMMEDPAISDCLAELYDRPLGLLRPQIDSMRTSQGAPVRMEMCLMPEAVFGSFMGMAPFWKKVRLRSGFPALDLSDQWTVLVPSFGPLASQDGFGHMTSDGHLFTAFVLARTLIHEGLVPLAPPAGSGAAP